MKLQNLYWAIDVENKNLKVQEKVAKYMKIIKAQSKVKIVPTTVLPLGEFGFVEDLTKKEKDEYTAEYTDKCLKMLMKLGFDDLTPKIVNSRFKAGRKTVKALAQFATRHKGDGIVVLASRNQTGLRSFFLGSFAEDFLFGHPLSALVIHPDTKVPRKFNNALLAFDVLNGKMAQFNKICDMYKHMGIESTTLYYYIRKFQKRGDDAAHRKLEKKVNEAMKKFEAAALKKGLKVKISVESKTANLKDSILKKASTGSCDVVTIVGKTSKERTLLLGSTTRAILRESKLPVLIYHT